MKKGFYFLLIMMGMAIAVASCDDSESYTDMLNAQRKAINNLIADSGFVILSKFPTDSVFASNEFVKLDDEFYLNIIDKGNSDRAVLGQTDIQCRFTATFFMDDEWGTGTLDLLGPHSNGTYPVEFKYGYYTTGLYDYTWNIFISSGLAGGLPYVGDSAYVKLIVPFEYLGSDFQSTGTAIFFEKVRYIFKK